MPQVCHAVDRMDDTRVLFICVTAVRLRAACAVSTVCVHIRHPAAPPGHSQSARTCVVGWKNSVI